MIRSFIAIHLPDETRDEIRRMRSALKKSGADVKWVRPESVHLTLKFLGNVPEEIIDPLADELRTCLADISPFILHIDGTGVFPNPRKMRVVWLGLGGDQDALADLHKAVEKAARAKGFEPEDRAFRPHLTLGRTRTGKGRGPLLSLMEKTAPNSISFTVDEVILFRSDLRPTGADYTPLHRIAL